MIQELRQSLRALEKPAGLEDAGVAPLGVPAIDLALGGGLARGALHEIAAAGEAHVSAAAGFALGVAPLRSGAAVFSSPLPSGERSAHEVRRVRVNGAIESHFPPHPTSPGSRPGSVDLSPMGRGNKRRSIVWIAEDMALAESGAPYGPGLDAFGLRPERLLTVATAHSRDLLWAMEEALRCRAVSAVIGELRHGAIDNVAVRRLSLAAAASGALALLLRASPPREASTAATRWIVGAAPSLPVIPGRARSARARNPERHAEDLAPGFRVCGLTPASRNDEEKFVDEKNPCFAVHLTRNRRGPLGAWILQWSDDDGSDDDGRFLLATHAQPVAAPAADRPHCKVA